MLQMDNVNIATSLIQAVFVVIPLWFVGFAYLLRREGLREKVNRHIILGLAGSSPFLLSVFLSSCYYLSQESALSLKIGINSIAIAVLYAIALPLGDIYLSDDYNIRTIKDKIDAAYKGMELSEEPEGVKNIIKYFIYLDAFIFCSYVVLLLADMSKVTEAFRVLIRSI